MLMVDVVSFPEEYAAGLEAFHLLLPTKWMSLCHDDDDDTDDDDDNEGYPSAGLQILLVE
jgi:hypothetical protein